MFALAGILLALLARERTCSGQHVDIAMADGVAQLLSSQFSSYYMHKTRPERGRHWISGCAPYYTVYQCADNRFLSLGAVEPGFWANLCRELGHEELRDLQQDRSRWPEVRSALEKTFQTRSRDEWFALLCDKDVCVAPVYELDEVENDPQLRAREMFLDIRLPHGEGVGDSVTQIGFAIKLGDTPAQVRCLAPQPGEHTNQVLQMLGYSPGDISALRESGAVY